METRTVERVEGWQARSVSDGFRGLRDLADRSFSGAVTSDGAWLFMSNGRVVGVFDGQMEDFSDGSATAYDAPDPAVALLLAMQEHGGDRRGRYYTEETPLSEVDGTLSGGNFTGYVELSENVLSGDYYVVYSSGRSMSAAWVGASEQLVTGDEAFESAVDEVGIYEVVDVDLDVLDVPEPPEPDPESAAGGVAVDDATDPDHADDTDATTAAAEDPSDPTDADAAVQEAEPADETPDAPAADGPDEPPERPGTAAAEERPDAVTEADPSTATEAGDASDPVDSPGTSSTEGGADPGSAGVADPAAEDVAESGSAGDVAGDDPSPGGGSANAAASRAVDRPATDAGADVGDAEGTGRASADQVDAGGSGAEAATGEDVFSEEAEWRETRSIPALDPDDTDPGVDGEPSPERAGDRQAGTGTAGTGQQGRNAPELHEAATERQRQVAALKERLAEVEAERESLAADRGALETERDDLREERDRLQAKLEETRAELASVRQELDSVRRQAGSGGQSTGGSGTPGGQELSPAEALEGTNLFVRYDSKGKPTLETARDESADREAVDANLRLEHHTQFEADRVVVDGQPYREFLTGTLQYRFVDWVVRDLLYEIRDSGHRGGLADLFAAIPEIDRAQLHGTVSVRPDEESGETVERAFDVVLRDKMGRPLVVVDLSTGRSPVTGEMMGSLIDDATAVAEASEHLDAAVSVTASFFRPDALEAATEATGGGFLSRDKRESFVRVGRKQGYHLCLIEAREGSFHLSIPEL